MAQVVYIYYPPDGLTDQGATPDITFAEGTFLSKDVWRFGSSVGGQIGVKERGNAASTTFTWEDMGVPEKSYVTKVDAVISKYLLQNTNLVQHAVRVSLLDTNGTNICGLNHPFEVTLSNTLDVSFNAISDANGAEDVLFPFQDSLSALKMRLEVELTTSPGTTQYILNLDYVEFTITYHRKSHNQSIGVFTPFI